MKKEVTINVNGTSYTEEVEPRLLLVHFIRENLELTGTHIGCDTSHCGSCTILLNCDSVKSCTIFTVQADGAEIATVEGMMQDGKYHPLQEAFKEYHGLQCGFCTPGMLMRAIDFLKHNPDPTEEEIRWGISSNLCRCTGYNNIVIAIEKAAEKMREEEVETETVA